MNNNQQWYYTDASGQQAGPVTEAQLKQLLSNGTLSADTMVWAEGMENWVLSAEVSSLQSVPTPSPSQNPSLSPIITQAAAPYSPQAANPYAPPQTQVTAAPVTDDDYFIPDVKRTNYGLFAGTFIVGFLLLIAGFFVLGFTQETRTTQSYGSDPYGFNNSSSSSSEVSVPAIVMMVLGFGFLMWGGILGLIYLHRAWRLVQPGGATTTPGKAVGFLFIPLFAIYWTFIAYRKLAAAPRAGEGLFLAYAILGAIGAFVSLAGLAGIVIYLIAMKQLCNIVNHMHDLRVSSPNQQSADLSLH
jgi:hypothetical protein